MSSPGTHQAGGEVAQFRIGAIFTERTWDERGDTFRARRGRGVARGELPGRTREVLCAEESVGVANKDGHATDNRAGEPTRGTLADQKVVRADSCASTGRASKSCRSRSGRHEFLVRVACGASVASANALGTR